MRSLFHPEERLSWDPEGVASIDILDSQDSTTALYYSKSKSQYSFISARDFLEKKVFFTSNGTYYHYYSALPDVHYPLLDDGTVRAYALAGFHVFKPIEDGSIEYSALS